VKISEAAERRAQVALLKYSILQESWVFCLAFLRFGFRI
jgi:hypothetical protein